MKKSRIFLTIITLALIILVFAGCKGVVPPSPGVTEDTEIIFGRIKMPLVCCATEEGILEEGSSDEECDETEFWPLIPNAMVELKSAAKGKCDKVIDTTYTDEEGNYRFDNVKPGLYIINAYCPVRKSTMKELFFLKDVANKISGQALDAGIPDCTSTALALVIEKINNCYNCKDDCFNTCTRIYQLVKEIADDVRTVDIDKILNHKKFGNYCDGNNQHLVDYVCGFLCCTSPGATGGGGGGGGGGGPTPNPAVEITKVADPTSVSEANTEVTYTYTVTNTGGVTLTGIVVSDDKLGTITLGTTTLTPGEFTTGTDKYTVTQTDLNAGTDIVNIATVTTTQGVTDNDEATVTMALGTVSGKICNHVGEGYGTDTYVHFRNTVTGEIYSASGEKGKGKNGQPGYYSISLLPGKYVLWADVKKGNHWESSIDYAPSGNPAQSPNGWICVTVTPAGMHSYDIWINNKNHDEHDEQPIPPEGTCQ